MAKVAIGSTTLRPKRIKRTRRPKNSPTAKRRKAYRGQGKP